MWPYNDDENGWLGQIGTPSASHLIPERIDFYRQQAMALRRRAIGDLVGRLARSAAEMFRHLGLLSSGNRTKMETAIAELRRAKLKPRSAGTAGR